MEIQEAIRQATMLDTEVRIQRESWAEYGNGYYAVVCQNGFTMWRDDQGKNKIVDLDCHAGVDDILAEDWVAYHKQDKSEKDIFEQLPKNFADGLEKTAKKARNQVTIDKAFPFLFDVD